MTTEIVGEAICLPMDRPVELGRFVFAGSGGSYRFTKESVRDGFEVCAEWCEPGELEPSDGGYGFWGGVIWFETPHEALAAVYEWFARAALDAKHGLDRDRLGRQDQRNH